MTEKQSNTQELLDSLEALVKASNRRESQLYNVNLQLRSIRHACNFVICGIVLGIVMFIWWLASIFGSVPIEQY